MIGWKSKLDKELIKALKKSESGFSFDPNSVKYRLLSSIEQQDQKPAYRFGLLRVGKYSVTFAGLVLILSVTFAFASNSKPGDKLFALNKLGEQVILNLPLSIEQKAKVQEYIVTSRLEALDQVQLKKENPAPQTSKVIETVKESDDTLMTAVDQISHNKQMLEAAGKTASAKKLGALLNRLQIMAQKREATIQALEDQTSDLETKAKLQNHLLKIENSRKKAQAENPSSDSD